MIILVLKFAHLYRGWLLALIVHSQDNYAAVLLSASVLLVSFQVTRRV